MCFLCKIVTVNGQKKTGYCRLAANCNSVARHIKYIIRNTCL